MKKRIYSILLTGLLFAACALAWGQAAPLAKTNAPATPSPSPSLSQDEIRELIRQAAEKDIQNDKHARDYTYVEREEVHKLDGSGRVKSTEIKTYDIMMLYGEPVERLTGKDDKPLPAKEAAQEDARIQKLIDKHKNESDEDRRKRLEKEEKQEEEGRAFVREIADAYNFRLAGVENLDGRPAYVIDADPRPGYVPQGKNAKFLPKFRFRVWIDRAEGEWVKVNIQCIDTASVGLFLARIHKGSNIEIEQTRVNDEVWLPQHIALKLDARLLLFKGLNLEEDVTYRDYKKFRTDTKILPANSSPR
jgi:hypothetical protein